MKYFQIIIIAICLFLSTGCEDFFTTTLNVEPPPHEDQMVLHSYVTSGDSLIGVSLSRSFGLLDDFQEDDYINDAVVKLYKDGIEWKTLEKLPQSFQPFNYGIQLEKSIGDNNSEYEIKIGHPDFSDISASQRMPTDVDVVSVKYKENAGIDEYGDRVSGVEITFADPAGEQNFYEISIVELDTTLNAVRSHRLYTETNDPTAFDAFDATYLLNDQTFDGKEYEITLLNCCFQPHHYVLFRVISKDLYQYTKSFTQQINSEDFGPFSEPVSINTNVENGLGIFGMRREKHVPIEF